MPPQPRTARRSTSSSWTDLLDPSAPLLEVGHIGKAHGLKGDVVVHLLTDRSERLDVGNELQTSAGPLRVERSQRDGKRWLVHFAGVETREGAEALRSTTLLAEPLDDPEELWVHELVGCRVISADGVDRGAVVEVQENPASDLLVLDGGALVPLTFLVDGPTDGVVRVDVPDGLWELF